MPLYKTITVDPTTSLSVWKIEESYPDLAKDVRLQSHHQQRVDGMKSDIHRRGFLSVRHLLHQYGYTDQDLWYDDFGKPHLKDGKHISITHSFEFSALIVSEAEVGIDIEMQRAKIMRIAYKFTPIEEYRTLANDDAIIRKLTMVWGAKESIYKSFAQPGLSFRDHIVVRDFHMEHMETTARAQFGLRKESYSLAFDEFEGFTLAYAQIQPE